MSQPTDLAQRSRDVVDGELRSIAFAQGKPGSSWEKPDAVLLRVHGRVQRERLSWEDAFTHWWDLVRLGVVAVVGDGNITGDWYPRLLITPRGRRWLEAGELAPYNWERYAAAIRKRAPAPDLVVIAYLREATGALAAELFRASIVTQGCACERLILLLGEAVRDARVLPYSDKLAKLLAGPHPTGISAVFDQVRGALVAIADDGTLPGDLAEAIDRNLTPIFERARGLRNRHGHPTGAEVSAEDAEAGLLPFPGFYELVERLRAHLAGRSK